MKHLTKIFILMLTLLVFAGSNTQKASAASTDLTTHIGIVDASSLRLRSGPSISSSTVKYAYRGDYVLITGKQGAWYQVEYNLTRGYMHSDYLSIHDAKNVELGYGSVTANKVNLRSGPGTSYSSLSRINSGNRIYIIGFNRQWYKVITTNTIGYIRSDYVKLTEIPYENTGSVNTPRFFIDGKSTGVTPSPSALQSGTAGIQNTIVANAKSLLGTPYVWGGTSPAGFDCSGFTQYVYAQSGIRLDRTTSQQVQHGTAVSKSNLQPGDLVFLKDTYRSGVSHVGIYIGDGKMIHASSSKGVTTSDLSNSYYQKHYHSARRIL